MILRVCLVLLMLTGCAVARPPVTAPADGQARVPAFDVNPVDRAAVKDGGTLTWALSAYPAQWNLNQIDGNHADVKTVVDALLPSMFRSDERTRLTPDPDYLTSAEISGDVVTYTLNPKAVWSNGKPLNWSDFAAQWQAMRGARPAYRVSGVTGYQDIAAVTRGADAHQVLVTFARPFGDWRSLFSPLYPSSANSSPQAFNSGWIGRIPVTAGPFSVAAFDGGARTVKLVRDPSWWGAPAKLDAIVFRALSADARAAAFANGEIDVFDVGTSAPDFARAQSTPGGVVRQAAGPDFRHLTFNGESPVLSDARVRRALALGVDREVLARSALQGLNWPSTPLDNHFLMNTQDGYAPNAGDLSRPDPVRAAALLEEAGWRTAGGVRVKEGRQLTVRVVVPSGQRLAKSEAELLQTMLRPLGVAVIVKTVPGNDYFTKYVIPGDYDIAPFAYVGTPYPVSASYATYANGTAGTGDEPAWNANLGRIGSPEIDAAMAAANAELDPAKAREKINAADRLIWREVNVLPLYQRPQNIAVRAGLANIGARGFRDLDYADIGYTS